MAKKKKKILQQENQVKIAKYTAIAAWSAPIVELIRLIRSLVKAFFKK
ncbi:hypothetical protein [Lactobacillus bombicola]|nr:hypothetical protein [Lactobacillus bombicola]